MKRLLVILVMLIIVSAGIANAAFISGSTGADGAFDPSVNTMLQLPPDGVFNFTTINIRSGVTVTFKRNAANTPVYMLATGDVTIAGNISVNGEKFENTAVGGTGGPGGFAGGTGGGNNMVGGNGLGPGGGGGGKLSGTCCYYEYGGGGGYGNAGTTGGNNAGGGAGGATYGNSRIIPFIGGSGGGGGAWYNNMSLGGGGGGGAVLIASSGRITISGSIIAKGGGSCAGWYYSDACYAGGGGSGGAIKLMANEITGSGSISAKGGIQRGGEGRIRLEATSITFSAGTTPPFTSGFPKSVLITNIPSLQITSIAGQAAPSSPTGSYAQPDLALPSTTANPVSVAVSASNIPPGTTVTVYATPQYGTASSASAVLAGTTTSSAATANVTISTTYTSVIMATTTVTIQAMYYNGERIETAIVKALPGQESEVTYVSESGKKIKEEQLILAGLVRR